MLEIDGSFGEGGGQILRSSLALAMVTGTPVRIRQIRAGRRKPGLLRQHLTAVQAAKRVSGGYVVGDSIGSTDVVFEPGIVAGGHYEFDVGSAGSTTLVLQTILLPLMLADKPSRIALGGGTHNPFAPPFDFLEQAYLPLVNRMGPNVRATLERPGFFPAGGGRIVVEIEPAKSLRGFELLERGALKRRHARALVSNLPSSIAEREVDVLSRQLRWNAAEIGVEVVTNSRGPGNVVTIALVHEHVTEVFTAFGEVRRSAETVANHAAGQCLQYMKHTAVASEFLTDQLMLPMAIAGRGAFTSTEISRHSDTHIALIRQFLNVSIDTRRSDGDGVLVTFAPAST